MGFLRSSAISSAPSDHPTSNATSLFPYYDPFSHAPSSSFLGPPGLFPPSSSTPRVNQIGQGGNGATPDAPSSTITYHGVCLTIWSHADTEHTSTAIRRTLAKSQPRASLHTSVRMPRPHNSSTSQKQAEHARTMGRK